MAQFIRCRECGAQMAWSNPELVSWLNLHVDMCAQQEYAFEAFPAIEDFADDALLKAQAEIQAQLKQPRVVAAVRAGDLRA
jgi:hypothetical protein